MTFRYYMIFDREDPESPQGLIAINSDEEAGRLDMIAYDHPTREWESNPDAVGLFLFGEDYFDEREEVSRARAEEIARMIGTALPSEEEMMRISDEAERQREARRRRFRFWQTTNRDRNPRG